MAKKPTLSELAAEDEKAQAKPKRAARKKADLGLDTPRGERGEFIMVAVRLPPGLYEALQGEVHRRRARREKDVSVSSVARIALAEYLERDMS